jgi:hypothetical protein
MNVTVTIPDADGIVDAVLEDGDYVLADGVTREDAIKDVTEELTDYAQHAVDQQWDRDKRQGNGYYSSDFASFSDVFTSRD